MNTIPDASGIPDDNFYYHEKLKGFNRYPLMTTILCGIFAVIYLFIDSIFLSSINTIMFFSCILHMHFTRESEQTFFSAHFFTVIFTIFITTLCIASGGFRSPVIIWFLILPMGAGFLINFRASIFYGALSACIISIFFFVHSFNVHMISKIPYEYSDNFYALQLFSMLVVVITLISKYLKIQASTIDRLYQSEKKFRETSARAENASKTKSELLANMSHEIRTPMNGIIGIMHILLDTDLSQKQKKYLTIIFNSAKALLTIINDILDFSKIESGKIDFDFIHFDLRVAISDISELPSLQARQKGIEFVLKIDSEVPSLFKGDPARIRQILINLISNAIKFTDTGEVVLHVSLENDHETKSVIRFSIEDTGIGFSEDKLDGLFESFTQADSSTTKIYGGTGLGLSICKLLVKKLGGEIGASSEEFIGSTFWFTLPLEKLPPGEKSQITFTHSIKDRKALIVSDNLSASEPLKELLNSLYLKTIEAKDHKEAIDLIKHAEKENHPFDAVFVDCHEGTFLAENLGRTIKTDDQLKQAGLIIITSTGEKGDAKRFEDAGFSAYLSRPIDKELLHNCFSAVAAKKINSNSENTPIITRHSIAESQKHSAKILIAEDNKTNLIVIRELLKKLGYTADSAKNGQEALERYNTHPYDIILMDCQMPVMDGYEATQKIRAMEKGKKQSKIIAMTANALKGDREKCLEIGMDDYMSKPIDPDILLDILKRNTPQKNKIKQKATKKIIRKKTPKPEDKIANKVFDKETMLQRFGNDDDLVQSILDSFLVEYPAIIKKMRSAAKEMNMEDLKLISHALKGSSSNVNALFLKDAAFQMEEAAKKNDASKIPLILNKIENAFEEFSMEVSV